MATLKYFEVTAYGAMGTGGDDTSGIVAAEAAAEAAGGGVVHFPPGTYRISSTVTIKKDGIQWMGTGPGSSFIAPHATSTTAPTLVQTQSGVNEFTLYNLGFIGNGQAPSGTATAPPTIVFNGGQRHQVLECYFTNNTGQTLRFIGAAKCQIANNNFKQVGLNDGTDTGLAYRTDAITVDPDCQNFNINNNYLDTCKFGGICVAGAGCDIANNRVINTSVTGIFFSGTNTRATLNSIQSTTQLTDATTQSAGIQADAASDFIIFGNSVSHGDGDGVAITNGWAYGVVLGNNCWNNGYRNSASIGDSGIKIAPHGGSDREGLVVLGNTSVDDGTQSSKQAYGIHLNTTDSTVAHNSCIIGNSTNGNVMQGIFEENPVMVDDSNCVMGNSDWLDRLHSASVINTKSATSPKTIGSTTINAGSMRQRCGIRITASGTSVGSHAKTFELGFGSGNTTNVFSYTTTITLPTGAAPWQLIAVVINNNSSPSSQVAMAMLFVNSQFLHSWETTISPTINTSTTSAPITLSALGASGSTTDYVQCDFFLAERC